MYFYVYIFCWRRENRKYNGVTFYAERMIIFKIVLVCIRPCNSLCMYFIFIISCPIFYIVTAALNYHHMLTIFCNLGLNIKKCAWKYNWWNINYGLTKRMEGWNYHAAYRRAFINAFLKNLNMCTYKDKIMLMFTNITIFFFCGITLN